METNHHTFGISLQRHPLATQPLKRIARTKMLTYQLAWVYYSLGSLTLALRG